MPERWRELVTPEFAKPYWAPLTTRVREEYLTQSVFPHPKRIFRALESCAPEEVKVVILGQDPYHTPGVADGLAFSTLPGNPVPPSLQNIFKEIAQEYGTEPSKDPELSRWATQGVLLLNASLTVRSGEANAHAEYGWHEFTDAIISAVSREEMYVVFMLWGSFAQKKAAHIDATKHLVLTAPHPSPLSAHRGFFGCGHFKKANEYLREHGRGEVEWR